MQLLTVPASLALALLEASIATSYSVFLDSNSLGRRTGEEGCFSTISVLSGSFVASSSVADV
jgi:hypothetical protein